MPSQYSIKRRLLCLAPPPFSHQNAHKRGWIRSWKKIIFFVVVAFFLSLFIEVSVKRKFPPMTGRLLKTLCIYIYTILWPSWSIVYIRTSLLILTMTGHTRFLCRRVIPSFSATRRWTVSHVSLQLRLTASHKFLVRRRNWHVTTEGVGRKLWIDT